MAKRLTDEELVSVCERAIRDAGDYIDSKLSQERKKVLQYYKGEKPDPVHTGNSKYVSNDVFDSVDSMRATLLEAFSAHQRIVQFAPQSAKDIELAKQATEYCSYVTFRQNDASRIFHTVISDGLMARNGICKVVYEELDERSEEEFKGLTEDELDALLGDDNVELISVEEDGQLFNGSVLMGEVTKRIALVPVPPEEFGIAQQATSIREAKYCYHRSRKTLSQLKKMGFDADLVDSLASEATVNPYYDVEKQERFDINGGYKLDDEEYQDQIRSIDLYELYIEIDPDGSGVARLHKIWLAGRKILEKTPVSRKPFAAFAPLPNAHAFYGENFAQKVIATQNSRTVLVRSILDHAVITNNPRLLVMSGAVPNPSELMDNRIGGLVNVKRLDGVMPLPQAPLNPYVFQTIQLLDEDKEEATGISRLSQGLNKDAISKQNSASMVEQLISVSQQRQKIIARGFGEFLKELYLLIYETALEFVDSQEIIDVAGNFQQVTPSEWQKRKHVTVELSLGYQEREMEARKWIELDQYISANPRLASMYTPQNQYEVLSRALERQGVLDVEAVLTPPEKLPPPQPDPMQILQMQMLQADIQAKQVANEAAKVKLAHEKARIGIEANKASSDAAHAADQMDLEERKFQHTVVMDAAELDLAKQAQENKTVETFSS